MSLYKQTIPQLLKMFTNLESWLGKAEAFCAENDIEPGVLLDQRIYPNMYAFHRQVLRALSNGNLLADRLTGTSAPQLPDEADSFDALRKHVATSKAFIERSTEVALDGADAKPVTIPGIDGMVIRADDMATEFSIPNVYFHLTSAYAILRQTGVNVGKADFIGPMNLAPAKAPDAPQK